MIAIPDRRLALLILTLLGLWLAMMLLGGWTSSADLFLLHAFRLPALDRAALAVTRLGNAYVLLPLSLIATLFIAWRVGRRPALVYLVLILSGRFLAELEKYLVARSRPDPAGRLDPVVSMAFPSAHAANSMIAWLGLALIAAPPKARPVAVGAALGVALLVGLTRLVLAVHWPSDVIGGWSFGAAWTLIVLRAAQGWSGRTQGRRIA